MSAKNGQSQGDSIRAKLAVAVLRTVRVARVAQLNGRAMGQRTLTRLYLRNRSDLDPAVTPSVEDPGAQFLLKYVASQHGGLSAR